MKKLVLAAAFIGFSGFAMAQQIGQKGDFKKMTPQEREQKMQQMEQKRMDKMKQELNLSDAQVRQLQAMHDKDRAERKAEFEKNKPLRDAKKAEFEQKRAQKDAEMKRILTPDQYAKWQAKKAEMKNNRKEKMHKFGKRMDAKQGPNAQRVQ